MPVSGCEADLSWLSDAPVFIDGQLIGAFYDALVGREFRTVQLQLSAGQSEQLERSAGGSVNVGSSTLFPWLKIGAGADRRRARSRGRQWGQSVVLEPVESPSMRLVQLTLHYMGNQPNRIRTVTCGTEVPGEADISASPPMLTFLDVSPGAKFLPESVEFDGGRVVTFFSALADVLQPDGSSRPVAYPAEDTTDEGMRQRDAHWKWYVDRWNSQEIVKAVEEVIGEGGGRPQRIDYKMFFATGEELNLRVGAHGDYDTHLFAYDLIRRGWRHGVRIIGSLKSEPTLNVLAIYEK